MKKLLASAAILGLCAGQAHANTCTAIQAGATDQTVYVTFLDATTGVPNSSLAFNSSGIDIEYVRTGAAAVDITEATQTAAGAHSDGGFVSVGHGRYRLDLPDAAVATGAREVVIQGVITGYVLAPCTIPLSPPANVVSFGGTAGTFASGRPEVNVSHFGGAAGTFAAGRPEVNTSHIGGSAISQSGGVANVNLAQVSLDSAAADKLELCLDGSAGACEPLGIVDQGTAQSATGTTLVLRAALAMGDDTAVGMTLVACGSTQGYCQARAVTDYVSATDTATVETWTVTPSGTITYYLFGTAPSAAGGGLDAAGVRAAVGLASANLDTQLSGVQSDTNDIQARLPAALVSGRMDSSVGAYQSGQAPLQPTTAGRTLDVSAGGEAGIDWSNVGSPTSSVTLSGTTVGTATTLTNAPSDSSGVTTLLSRLTATRAGYLDNLSAGAVATAAALTTLSNDLAALAADIGSNGSGLTQLPWNAAYDAEVQSEVTDALMLLLLTEPAAKPSWGSSTVWDGIAYLTAWARNKVTQTSTTKTLRNDADNANLLQCTVSDSGGTFTLNECTP